MFEMMIRDLDNLSPEQLATLNQESARVWNEKNAEASKSYKKGDNVQFKNSVGTVLYGKVLRRGRKTVTVEVITGNFPAKAVVWRVNPYRLHRAA